MEMTKAQVAIEMAIEMAKVTSRNPDEVINFVGTVLDSLRLTAVFLPGCELTIVASMPGDPDATVVFTRHRSSMMNGDLVASVTHACTIGIEDDDG